jgi:hypothetical protein
MRAQTLCLLLAVIAHHHRGYLESDPPATSQFTIARMMSPACILVNTRAHTQPGIRRRGSRRLAPLLATPHAHYTHRNADYAFPTTRTY